jgi:hypothetical protein
MFLQNPRVPWNIVRSCKKLWNKLKARKEIICCQSRKNCECVRETFGEEFLVVQKETSPHVAQKGNLIITSDVNFYKDRKNALVFFLIT